MSVFTKILLITCVQLGMMPLSTLCMTAWQRKFQPSQENRRSSGLVVIKAAREVLSKPTRPTTAKRQSVKALSPMLTFHNQPPAIDTTRVPVTHVPPLFLDTVAKPEFLLVGNSPLSAQSLTSSGVSASSSDTSGLAASQSPVFSPLSPCSPPGQSDSSVLQESLTLADAVFKKMLESSPEIMPAMPALPPAKLSVSRSLEVPSPMMPENSPPNNAGKFRMASFLNNTAELPGADRDLQLIVGVMPFLELPGSAMPEEVRAFNTWTPLMRAAYDGNLEAIKAMQFSFADVKELHADVPSRTRDPRVSALTLAYRGAGEVSADLEKNIITQLYDEEEDPLEIEVIEQELQENHEDRELDKYLKGELRKELDDYNFLINLSQDYEKILQMFGQMAYEQQRQELGKFEEDKQAEIEKRLENLEAGIIDCLTKLAKYDDDSSDDESRDVMSCLLENRLKKHLDDYNRLTKQHRTHNELINMFKQKIVLEA